MDKHLWQNYDWDSRFNRRMVEEAIFLGANVKRVDGPLGMISFQKGDNEVVLFGYNLLLNGITAARLADNKEATKMLLGDHGIQVPRGIYLNKDYSAATLRLKKRGIRFPVVLKPLALCKGEGVRVGIENEKHLERLLSHSVSAEVIVEEMFHGRDFRVFVFENEVLGCVERIPPSVTGDGNRTVRQLIERENKNKPNGYTIVIDQALNECVSRRGYSLDSMLPNKVVLQVRDNANASTGGAVVSMTKRISAEYKRIAIQSANALGLRIAGVDVLTNDISGDASDDEYRVIEVNANPDYDVHEKPIVQGDEVNIYHNVLKTLLRQK